MHSGSGNPDYGPYPTSMLLYINEVPFYTQRPFVQMMLSGVFERFPRLKFVMTEAGCAWVPPMLERLDHVIRGIRDTGATGEIRYGADHVLPRDASEYFQQNCWMGVSQPGPDDVAARHIIGLDKFMWGSDYPHDEGTYPYTREAPAGPLPATLPRPSCARSWPATPPTSTTSTSTPWRRWPPASARPSTRSPPPSTAVPDKELQRISGDMDYKAIK